MGARPQGCDTPAPAHEPTTIAIPTEYPTLRAAIEAACNGDTPLLSPGIHAMCDLRIPAAGLIARSLNPLDSLLVRDTVLDGSGCEAVWAAIRFTTAEGAAPSHLEGVTVSDSPNHDIMIDSASPVIDHCAIVRNNSGGIYDLYAAPTIRHCLIAYNHAPGRSGEGGGIYLMGEIWNPHRCKSRIIGCTLLGNSANSYGGLFVDLCEATVRNCLFTGNRAEHNGGGAGFSESSTVGNCLFIGNRADIGGGVVVLTHTGTGKSESIDVDFTNCTISGNTALEGGGLGVDNFAHARLDNCIIWNNTPSTTRRGSPPAVDYFYTDDEERLRPGTGNLSIDPLLISVRSLLAVPAPGSPCIDSGDPSIQDQISDWPSAWPPNYPNGARSDMGAYGGKNNLDDLERAGRRRRRSALLRHQPQPPGEL
jgi:hypothetical protein